MTDLKLSFLPEYKHLIIKNEAGDEMYDTSIANGIRRAVMNTSKCYALTETLTEDMINTINSIFDLNFNPDNKMYTVFYTSFDNVQKLSHRLSRMPIYYGKETEKYLESGNLIVTYGSDPTHPYVHESNEPLRIYSRNLTVTHYPGSEEEESKSHELNKDEKADLFKYNSYLFTLHKGDILHMFAQPVAGYGATNTKFNPCPTRYCYVSDDMSSIAGERNYARNGEVIKDMCGNPEQIEIRVEENGKKHPIHATADAIEYMIDQIKYFQQEYANDTSEVVKLKESGISNLQIIQIFNPTEEADRLHETDSRIDFIADYTLANMITSHMLYKVLSIIYLVAGTDETVLFRLMEQTKIACLKPHPNPRIMEMQIKIQVPDVKLQENQNFLNRVREDVGDVTSKDIYKLLLDSVCEDLIEYLSNQLAKIETLTY